MPTETKSMADVSMHLFNMVIPCFFVKVYLYLITPY